MEETQSQKLERVTADKISADAKSKCSATALALQSQVGELQVVDEISFNKMASIEQTAKENVKALEGHMKTPIEDAHAKHKKLTKLRNDLTSPFKDVAKAARTKCLEYAEAEKQKAAAEARRIAEEQRKAEEEARLAQAEALEAQGESKQAEQVLEAPVMPAPVAHVAPTVSVKGAREQWSAEITDARAMFEAWGTGKAAMPDLSQDQLDKLCTVLRLHDLARGLKANLESMVPGLRGVKRII